MSTAATPSTHNSDPHDRGGRVAFEVAFTSPMRDGDLSVLAHHLDLWRHLEPKLHHSPAGPGVARLDDFTGLFLERGDGPDRWMLQARTWGDPPPRLVHEWLVLAAQAARRLDPSVPLPERLSAAPAPAAQPSRRLRPSRVRARRTPPSRTPESRSTSSSVPACCQAWIAEQAHGWAAHRHAV
jgi:hypothetical protein